MGKNDPRNATYPMWDIKGELGKGGKLGHKDLSYDQYCRWALEVIARIAQPGSTTEDELLATAKDAGEPDSERIIAFVSLMANGAVFGRGDLTNAMHGLVCRDPLFKAWYESAMTVDDYIGQGEG